MNRFDLLFFLSLFLLGFVGFDPPPTRSVGGEEGVEAETRCRSGETAAMRLRLGDWPGGGPQQAYYSSGSQAFGGSWVATVSVLDWGGARGLTVQMGDVSWRVRPGAATLRLPPGQVWFGQGDFASDGNPLLLVTTRCPGTAHGPPRAVPPAFRLDPIEVLPWQVDAARDLGLPVVGAGAPWLVRISDDRRGLRLIVELEGMSRAVVLPLERRPGDRLSFDASRGDLRAAGEVWLDGDGLAVAITELAVRIDDRWCDLGGEELWLAPYHRND